MNKMGCGCDLGCDLGCDCHDKSVLGQIEQVTGMNPWWFLAGAGIGAGLWYLVSRPSSAGKESIMPVPSIASPARYQNLQAVATRLQEIAQLYPASITPEQALTESEKLKDAANGFSLQDGERVSEVIAAINDFQVRVKDFMQFKRDNPSIPQYAPATPVANLAPRFSAFA